MAGENCSSGPVAPQFAVLQATPAYFASQLQLSLFIERLGILWGYFHVPLLYLVVALQQIGLQLHLFPSVLAEGCLLGD